MIIRTATINDAKALLNIYSYYVENTAVSFEYTTPTLTEFQNRIQTTLTRYPYLVAEDEGEIIGYCYVGQLRSRAAFCHSVETSIYIDKTKHKKGIGRLLYSRMEEILMKMNITNMYACIIYPKVEDKYLNFNSYLFHQKLGFKKIAEFTDCGLKFNNWYNMIFMEKIIAPHKKDIGEVIPFPSLSDY